MLDPLRERPEAPFSPRRRGDDARAPAQELLPAWHDQMALDAVFDEARLEAFRKDPADDRVASDLQIRLNTIPRLTATDRGARLRHRFREPEDPRHRDALRCLHLVFGRQSRAGDLQRHGRHQSPIRRYWSMTIRTSNGIAGSFTGTISPAIGLVARRNPADWALWSRHCFWRRYLQARLRSSGTRLN